MRGILAAAPSGSHITSQIQSIPIVLIYLACLAIFVLLSLKVGEGAWHHIVVAFIFGVLFTVAIPKSAGELSSYSSTSHRVVADAVLVTVMFIGLILTVRDKRNSK